MRGAAPAPNPTTGVTMPRRSEHDWYTRTLDIVHRERRRNGEALKTDKEQTDPALDPDTLRDRHPSPPRPSRTDTGGDKPDAQPQTRNRMAPSTDVVLGTAGWANSDLYPSCRAPYALSRLPRLDRPALVTPQDQGVQVRATSQEPVSRPPTPLVVHPLPRGRMERRGRSLLRRLANELRLGRTRRQRGSALASATDGSGRDRVQAVRLLRCVARGTVAQYVATLSRVSVRVTFRV